MSRSRQLPALPGLPPPRSVDAVLSSVTQPPTHGQPLSMFFFSHLVRATPPPPQPSLSLNLSSSRGQNIASADPIRELRPTKPCSVQFRRVRLFETPLTAARQASLSITNSQSLLKLMSLESVMPSNHLILCQPLLLQPSVFPSIRVFSSELALRIR